MPRRRPPITAFPVHLPSLELAGVLGAVREPESAYAVDLELPVLLALHFSLVEQPVREVDPRKDGFDALPLASLADLLESDGQALIATGELHLGVQHWFAVQPLAPD